MSSFNFGSDPTPPKLPAVPERPNPTRQDAEGVAPWFVEDVKTKPNLNEKTKTAVKKTSTVLFPLIGLTVIIGIIAAAVYLVTGFYG